MLRFIFLLFCFHVLSLQAQNSSTLYGQIIDSTTLVPIPFAHLRLRESTTISNQHGNFTLNYDEANANVEVTISCIGYKTQKVSIADLMKSNKIVLVPDITILGEVVVSELGPQTIFEKAEKKGFKNYKTLNLSST